MDRIKEIGGINIINEIKNSLRKRASIVKTTESHNLDISA